MTNPTTPTPAQGEKPKRTCNRHDDCDAADARERTRGRLSAEHCHDECCEDCFGY